jgi:flavin reductase (DIM6/NTAB) family NADH-FMN oxidoreductase RutF
MSSSHGRPPDLLDVPLELDPSDWTRAQTYDLVTSLVVPRPVAWVSTLSTAGGRNLAPHSYFNLVADCPPHVAFSSIGVKDTLRNILATGEFVVNLAGRRLLAALDATAADVPADVDEFLLAGLTPAPARCVRAPRVAEAPAHLECVLVQVVQVGNGNLVIGRVVHVHVDPSVWKDRRVAPDLLDPVVRVSRRYGALTTVYTAEEPPSAHVLPT